MYFIFIASSATCSMDMGAISSVMVLCRISTDQTWWGECYGSLVCVLLQTMDVCNHMLVQLPNWRQQPVLKPY